MLGPGLALPETQGGVALPGGVAAPGSSPGPSLAGEAGPPVQAVGMPCNPGWRICALTLPFSPQRGVNTDSGSVCREASFEGISK